MSWFHLGQAFILGALFILYGLLYRWFGGIKIFVHAFEVNIGGLHNHPIFRNILNLFRVFTSGCLNIILSLEFRCTTFKILLICSNLHFSDDLVSGTDWFLTIFDDLQEFFVRRYLQTIHRRLIIFNQLNLVQVNTHLLSFTVELIFE